MTVERSLLPSIHCRAHMLRSLRRIIA